MIKNFRWASLRSFLSLQNIVVAGIIAVMTVTFMVIVASLDRGFNWTDEGFVYAMLASDRVSTGEVWGFHYLLGPLYELMGGSVLVFRVLRLLGYVALGVVLTLLARILLKSMGIELGGVGWFLVALVAQVGTFSAWSYPPRYLGYNELSSWLTQIGAALLILLLLEGRGTHGGRLSRRWWLWSITGAVLSALILAKISAGIFLSALAFVAALLATNGGVWWKRLGGLLGGLATGFLLMLASGVPLVSYFSAIVQFGADPSAQAESGYSITGLLATYLSSMSVTVVVLAVPALLAGVVLLVARGFDIDAGPVRRIVTSAESVTLFLAFVLSVTIAAINVLPGTSQHAIFPEAIDGWSSLGVSNAFLLALALLSYGILASPKGSKPFASLKRDSAAAVLGFGLFVLAPLISALGTNTRIFNHTVFSVTIWALGAAIGLVILWRRSTAISSTVRSLPVILLGVIVASSGMAVAGEVFVHPYLSTPYFTQKSVVEMGDLRGISLTGGEAELYEWLTEAGPKLGAQNVPTLSIASPGAQLAFNANSWAALWPGPAWPESIAQSCNADRPDKLFVLQAASEEEGTRRYDRLVAGLATCGIDFPADFEVVDRHSSDDPQWDVRVWRLG